MEILDAALHYGELGFRVFPVRLVYNEKRMKYDKFPATANGFHDGTTDADKIRTMWSTPGLGIGMVHDQFTIVDADGELGVNTLNRVMPRLQEPSVVTRTISGGIHFVVAGATSGSRDQKMLPGIDFLTGDTGFFVVPPTVGYTVLMGSFENLAADVKELESGRLGTGSEDSEGSR